MDIPSACAELDIEIIWAAAVPRLLNADILHALLPDIGQSEIDRAMAQLPLVTVETVPGCYKLDESIRKASLDTLRKERMSLYIELNRRAFICFAERIKENRS